MRGTVVALALVAATAGVGVLAYGSYTTEREFARLVAAGDRAAEDGRSFEALEAYSGALALVPDAVVAYLKRGRVYQDEGELEAALRDLRRAAELDPSATRPLEWMGDISLDLGRTDRAADYYGRYTALDDRTPRVLYKLGMALYRSGLPAEAVPPLNAALALDPHLVEARFLLGLAHRDQRALPAARQALEQAVKDAPGLTGAREALAEVLGDQGEHHQAIDQLETLSALDPDRPERLVAVGLAYARSGRDNQAVITLSRAIERFPDHPQPYAALGHVWLAMAERRSDRVALMKAVEALTQAAAHSTASSTALSDLGRALALSGDLAAAERALRRAVTRLPASPEAFLRLAAVTERQGRLLEARDALLQHAALVGDREPLAAIATRIADLSVRIGEPLLAVRWMDRAIDEAGPSAASLARLADAAWKGGDAVRARAAVAEGLELSPDDPTLRALRRRVGTGSPRP